MSTGLKNDAGEVERLLLDLLGLIDEENARVQRFEKLLSVAKDAEAVHPEGSAERRIAGMQRAWATGAKHVTLESRRALRELLLKYAPPKEEEPCRSG